MVKIKTKSEWCAILQIRQFLPILCIIFVVIKKKKQFKIYIFTCYETVYYV